MTKNNEPSDHNGSKKYSDIELIGIVSEVMFKTNFDPGQIERVCGDVWKKRSKCGSKGVASKKEKFLKEWLYIEI